MAINRKELWQIGATFFGIISAWVAAPIVLALFVGSWLDNRYQTAPWWTLGLVLSAFVISNIGIYQESKKLLNKLDQTKTKNTVSKTLNQNDRNQSQSGDTSQPR
ncbi:MAG: AtpZ/AtpI family protein [Candidatus Buchananbacteria bacterium]|nr:AtpZ/AtpI family protein [Candidatus Buchananbacteria bacterium]